jgi:hypothetical protein
MKNKEEKENLFLNLLNWSSDVSQLPKDGFGISGEIKHYNQSILLPEYYTYMYIIYICYAILIIMNAYKQAKIIENN